MKTVSKNSYVKVLVLAFAPITLIGCNKIEPAVVLVPATEVDESTSPQGHIAQAGGYTLRANAIQSDTIPPKMLARYGIQGGPDRGVLNLVVLQEGPDGHDVTVTADVTARQTNLAGQFREIEMQEITANNSTSYLGSFESSPQEYFQFKITAQPADSDKQLLVEFEERFAVLR